LENGILGGGYKKKYSVAHRIQGVWGNGISRRTLLQKINTAPPVGFRGLGKWNFGGGLLLKNKYSVVHRIQGAWGSGISEGDLLKKVIFFCIYKGKIENTFEWSI
jgi:hypothetical protein